MGTRGSVPVTDTQTEDDTEPRPVQLEPAPPGNLLEAEIVVSRDDPAECTVVPRDATVRERLTRWIRAEGEGFVSLETMR